MITCKRVYDDKDGEHEGYRVLVDRLWPRGVKRQIFIMMNGIKVLRLRLNCENGFMAVVEILLNLRNVIRKN